MRKTLIFTGVFVMFLALVFGAVLLFVDVNQFRPEVQSSLESRLHRTITLGPMGLKLLPLSIRIQNVAIGDNPSFGSQVPFLQANEMSVRVSLGALLSKKVEVESLRIVRPVLELVKNRAGEWNFENLSEPGGTAPTAPSSSSASSGEQFSLAELRIEDGQVAVTNQAIGKSRAVYDHIDLTVRNFVPGKQFNLEGSIHLPGKGKEEIALRADGSSVRDLKGSISLNDVSVEGFKAFLGSAGAQAGDAILGGETNFEAHANQIAGKGTLTITDTRVKEPVHLEFDFKQNQQTDVMDAQVRAPNASLPALMAVAMPGVSGSGTINLNLNLHGISNALVYNGEAKIAHARLSLPQVDKPVEIDNAEFKVNPDRVLAFSAAIGSLNLNQLQPNGPPVVLTNIRTSGTFQNGVVKADPVTANLFGGQHTGTITIDTRGKVPVYTLDSKLSSIDTNQLLSATSSVRNVIYGTMASNAALHISNASGTEFARGLNGNLSLLVDNGRLTGVQVLDEMAKLGKFIGYAPKGQGFTKILKLTGNMKFVNGVGTTDDLKLDFDGGSLSAAGLVNLADQTLDLKVTTILDKDTSQKVGGSKVAGLMSTVLSNGKGELVIPAIVRGTFERPRFEPDAARMATMKLNTLVPVKGGAQGIVDALKNPQQEKQGVMDVINAFKKKKSQ
jgi:uncharacterized protein involved in outer membrane biogenesis